MTVDEILADPDFHALAQSERKKILSSVDPDFSTLPEREKNKATVEFQRQFLAKPKPGDVPQWGKDNPNIYGAAGAAKEVGGAVLDAGSGLAEAAVNFVPSAARLVNSLGEAVASPMQTLSGIGDAAIGGAYKLTGQEDPYGKFDGLVDFFSNRYGSNEGLSEAIRKDPAAVLADLSAVATGGGALMSRVPSLARAGEVVSQVGRAVDPVSAAASGVSSVAGKIPKAVSAAGEKLTDMTLKQPTTLDPKIRQQNIVTAQEGGFLPKSSGVQKLDSAISANESKIASGINRGAGANIRGTLDKAVDNVESLRDMANRSGDPAANNALIDAEIARLRGTPLADSAGTIPVGELQKAKVEQGRAIQKSYGEQKPAFQNAIDKARVRGIKEELEVKLFSVFPELSATNKALGQQYQLKKVLERAANRIENNQGVGIGLPIKAGTGGGLGAAMGFPGTGAAIGTAIGIIEHPAVAPVLGQMLYRASKGKLTKTAADALAKQRLSGIAELIRSDESRVTTQEAQTAP